MYISKYGPRNPSILIYTCSMAKRKIKSANSRQENSKQAHTYAHLLSCRPKVLSAISCCYQFMQVNECIIILWCFMLYPFLQSIFVSCCNSLCCEHSTFNLLHNLFQWWQFHQSCEKHIVNVLCIFSLNNITLVCVYIRSRRKLRQ